MDPIRFDSLAKSFATGVSRRFVFKGLASIAAGSLVSLNRTAAASGCATTGKRCTEHDQCCSGTCKFDARGRGRCGGCPNQSCGAGEYQDPRDCRCHCRGDRRVCGTDEVCTSRGCVLDCDETQKVCGDRCVPLDGCCDDTECAGLDRPCTRGQCISGVCTAIAANQGASCDDDNRCTTGDTCQDGVCTGGSAVVCTTDNECLSAYCDPTIGCTTTPKGQGAPCNDGAACTTGDACDGNGHCVATGTVLCDDCRACDNDTGQCVADPDANQQPCTPPPGSNLCFRFFVCDTGNCVGAGSVTCASPPICHSDGTCDPHTGQCFYPAMADSTPCPSGPNATGQCAAGACQTVCDTNWGDCNDDPSDGCETNLLTDRNNCGMCHNPCSADQFCISGTCTTGCLIDDTFYHPDDPNPFNACQTCQPNVSTTSWTINGGAPCTISGNAGSCCANDGQCCASPICTCCGGYTCVSPDRCIAGECS